jgi:hypothetical protein
VLRLAASMLLTLFGLAHPALAVTFNFVVDQQDSYTVSHSRLLFQPPAEVRFESQLPKSFTIENVDSSQGSCDVSNDNVVTCDFGTVGSGGSVEVDFGFTPTKKGKFEATSKCFEEGFNKPVRTIKYKFVVTKP